MLERLYGQQKPPRNFDPMEELVSCILSQHTSDANSFPTFDKLRKTCPTWQEVVDTGPEKLAEVIRGAGLANQKSKSILRSLQAIYKKVGDYSLEHLRGMPMCEARAWLEALPGVGPKTASIVLCFSFGMPAIPVDTHIFRVSKRLGLIPEKMDEKRAHDLLLELVPPELAFRFHMALIQHGRNLCRAPIPKCEPCPLKQRCPWFLTSSGKKPGGLVRRKHASAIKNKKQVAPSRDLALS